MSKFAILIDAGFAKTKLGNREKPATSKDFIDLAENISSLPVVKYKGLHRVYFYDAPPYSKSQPIPLSDEKKNFGQDELTKHNKKLLSELRLADHFSLRLGEIRFRGWELTRGALPEGASDCTITSKDLKPSLQQKGVDMRIGLDIASLTLKKHVDVIVLVTGDSDFVPPMKFARREGIQLVLVTFGHQVHIDLIEHADIVVSDFD